MTDASPTALLERDTPPSHSALLRAVWHGMRGEWDAAHAIAQDDASVPGAWVHGWLHRIEGDLGNAAYWYRRAGRALPTGSTADEARTIAAALLADA